MELLVYALTVDLVAFLSFGLIIGYARKLSSFALGFWLIHALLCAALLPILLFKGDEEGGFILLYAFLPFDFPAELLVMYIGDQNLVWEPHRHAKLATIFFASGSVFHLTLGLMIGLLKRGLMHLFGPPSPS